MPARSGGRGHVPSPQRRKWILHGDNPIIEGFRLEAARVRRCVELGALLLHQAFAIATPLLEQSTRDQTVRHVAAEVPRRMAVAAAVRGVGVPVDVHKVSRLRLRLRLHDRALNRLRYMVRTIITSRRMHFTLVPLPAPLHPLYFVVKLGLDYVVLPIWLTARRLRRGAGAAGGR